MKAWHTDLSKRLQQRFHTQTKEKWGVRNEKGDEIWLTQPVFSHGNFFGWVQMLLKLKRIVPTIYLRLQPTDRVLDFGCGSGAQCVDMEKISHGAQVTGATVSQSEIDVAQQLNTQYHTHCTYALLTEEHLPFPDATFDKIYTSDVLGHVKNYQHAVQELARVLRPGGRIGIFSETKTGKHLWINAYLLKKGINVDPHAEFHISLHSTDDIRTFLRNAGFVIDRVYHPYFFRFITHPHWYAPFIRGNSSIHPLIRAVNRFFSTLRSIFPPLYDVVSLCLSYVELFTLGRFVATHGVIILAQKK